MLKIDLKVDTRQIDGLSGALKKGLAKSIVEAMLFAEGASKAIFKEGGPVLPPPGPLVARTGHLRRSIRSGIERGVGWVGTDVKYGKIHEVTGAGKAKVLRPFLGPSFQGKNLTKINEIILNGIFKEMT